MYHLIEFNTSFIADLVVSIRKPLERVRLQEGQRARVCLQPFVAKTAAGWVEMANLYFEDGSMALQVPFARFRFVD